MADVPFEPKPISDALKRHFDEVLAQIPTGKRGQIGVGVTTAGVEASLGTRWGNVTATGWAGRAWGGGGWLAGARVGYAF